MSKTATKQSATGFSEGKFDRVSFNVSLEGRGPTGPKAKTKAEQIVSGNLLPALDKLKKAGVVFEQAKEQASFNVAQHHTYDNQTHQNRPDGYQASFSLHLETKQVERVSEIQDVLTAIENVNVSSPSFDLDPQNRRNLQSEAVKDAFGLVQERFREECNILGLDAGEFEIEEWNAEYGDQLVSRRNGQESVRAASAMSRDFGGDEPVVKIGSGVATVTVTLEVGFRRKFSE